MRVGIDIQVARWTGAGLHYHLKNVVAGLLHLDESVQVFPFLYGQPWMDELANVRQFMSGLSGVKLHYYWDGPPLALWKKLITRVSRWRRRTEPALSPPVDVFHHTGVLVFPLLGRANVMTIADLTALRLPHCFDPQATTVGWFQEALGYANQMDLILTSSEHTKQDVVEALGISADRIRVAPLAAHAQYRPLKDKDQVRAVLARHGLAGKPYVLAVGTLEPRKNLVRLIEAFHQLRADNPSLEHQLVLVGAKGWMWEPIFDTIRRLQLDSQVRWLGYTPFEDLPALINGADLFVYPSLYEGFGLPPLEAMACGTPVIASGTSSLPEVVGDAGILIDPNRVDELAGAMHRALTDPELRTRLGQQGLVRSRLFSWEKTARLHLAAYREAWDRFRAGGSRQPSAREPETQCRKAVREGIINELYARRIRQNGITSPKGSGMSSFKGVLKAVARRLPLLREVIQERDQFRAERDRLRAERRKYGSFAPPGHFYSPIPDLDEVRAAPPILGGTKEVPGIDLHEEEQLRLLDEFKKYYDEQPFVPPKRPGLRFRLDNDFFGGLDAFALYGMIRHVRPRRIIEIGSGHSSCVILDTNELFFDNGIACTFIEPYPEERLLKLMKPGDSDKARVVPHKVQECDVAVFSELAEGDILFVDSTHVSKTNSDVNHIFFTILPWLRRGVYIHVHDIFYPFEYPIEWLCEGRFWNEAYLLRAFLQYNQVFRIVFFNSFLTFRHGERIRKDFPLCTVAPGSIWLQKVA